MFPAALRAILQMLLFCLFLYMYGLPAWEKLNQQSTIVIKTRENTKGIQAPSISIASINKATGFGWENITQQTKYENTLVHQCKNYSSVEACLASETYQWHQFINDTLLGFKNKLSLLNNKDVWVPDFTYASYGRLFTFHPNLRIGPQPWKEQIIISLSKGYNYEIFVHEPNFFILNTNDFALPSKRVRVASNNFKFYYKISAIQHIEKNVPGDPCIEDEHYSFTACVKESLALKVGCRPTWDVWSDQTIRNCTDIEEHRYVGIYLIPQSLFF